MSGTDKLDQWEQNPIGLHARDPKPLEYDFSKPMVGVLAIRPKRSILVADMAFHNPLAILNGFRRGFCKENLAVFGN